jgi:hypothetical protein
MSPSAFFNVSPLAKRECRRRLESRPAHLKLSSPFNCHGCFFDREVRPLSDASQDRNRNVLKVVPSACWLSHRPKKIVFAEKALDHMVAGCLKGRAGEATDRFLATEAKDLIFVVLCC